MSTATRVIPTQLTVREIAALIDHSLCALNSPMTTSAEVARSPTDTTRGRVRETGRRRIGRALAREHECGRRDGRGLPARALHDGEQALRDRRALDDGAREIDMVINIGALRGGSTTT